MVILLVIMHLKQMQNIHLLLVIPFVFVEVLVTFCSGYSDNLLPDYLSSKSQFSNSVIKDYVRHLISLAGQ